MNELSETYVKRLRKMSTPALTSIQRTLIDRLGFVSDIERRAQIRIELAEIECILNGRIGVRIS